jgi:mandelate racemase
MVTAEPRGPAQANLPVLSIRGLRTRAVRVPMRRPLGTSRGNITHAPLVLLDLETEEGVPGRAYLFAYQEVGAHTLRQLLATMLDMVRGDAVAPVAVAQKLHSRFTLMGREGLPTMAMSGVDCALWDALARAAGMPLARLLGGELRPVQAYNSNALGLDAPEKVADEAVELLAEGFDAVKLRLGRRSAAEDLRATRAVRQRIPAEALLMTDYNQALTVAEALARGRGLDGEGVYWIEEPVRHDDYAGAARIARELATPVQIGENFLGTRPMATAIAAGAADYVMPDLARIGGVTGWLRAAALADAAGIEMSSHLYPEVSAHLFAVTPTAHFLEYVDWAAPILERPLGVSDGQARPGDAPGAGLDWNEDAAARFVLES